MKFKIGVFLFFYLFFVSFVLMGSGGSDKGEDQLYTGSNILLNGIRQSHAVNYFGEKYVVLNFEVPDDVWMFDIRVTGATADLDIYLYNEEEVDDDSELFGSSETLEWNESVRYARFGNGPFATGPFTLFVEYPRNASVPRVEGMRNDSDITFDVEYNYYTQSSQKLILGENSVKLLAQRSMTEILRLEIPGEYRHLPEEEFKFRIDVISAGRDVDLLLLFASSFAEIQRDDVLVKNVNHVLRESLIYNPPPGYGYDASDKNLYFPAGEGEYFLFIEAGDGINGWPVLPEKDFDTVEVSLSFSWGLDVPSLLPVPPDLGGPEYSTGNPDRDYGIKTVQIFTPDGVGSGGFVSPDGYIITNNHVVRDDSGDISENVQVGVSRLDFRPVEEWFSAEVVDVSPADDLALLKVTGDRWERPLPEGYQFPYWEIGSAEGLRLGDEIIVLGYPEISGVAHSNLIYSRGSVSGGQYWNGKPIIGIDATVSRGSSGGVVLNARSQMVGIPFYINFDTGMAVGQVIPVERIPEEWRKRFPVK